MNEWLLFIEFCQEKNDLLGVVVLMKDELISSSLVMYILLLRD